MLTRWLRRSFSTSAATFLSATGVVPSAVSPVKSQHVLETPSSRGMGPERGPRSRIYILGQRKEEEVEARDALSALRAYSMTTIPETVAVDIKVDMTLKKVWCASIGIYQL